MGILGCVACIVGSIVIIIHAPQEHRPNSIEEIWTLATQPVATLSVVLALVLHYEPRYGQTNILVYLGIYSLIGSLTVVSIKAIGIAIKLTLEGIIQLAYPQTWVFVAVAVVLVITQLNYLNKLVYEAAETDGTYQLMMQRLQDLSVELMKKKEIDTGVSVVMTDKIVQRIQIERRAQTCSRPVNGT
ncbi:hypothetical protein IFM89_027755 [Coptis chinensis]|uniref:Probable magnesium transporter n=1 Tax=Coptis chinensis TaxID=261450 RepID=A0A835HXV3_9MAGN|nr:hypothetical protein IFM89_027755 [Coptis chinensis]